MGCFSSKPNKPPPLDHNEPPRDAQRPSPAPPAPPAPGRNQAAATSASKPQEVKKLEIKVDTTDPLDIIIEPKDYNPENPIQVHVRDFLGKLDVPINCKQGLTCKQLYETTRLQGNPDKKFLLGFKGKILYESDKGLGIFGIEDGSEINCYFEPPNAGAS